MKPQCKLRFNYKVMEALITGDCSGYKRTDEDLLADRMSVQFEKELYNISTRWSDDYIIDYPCNILNMCQRCTYYKGDYPAINLEDHITGAPNEN